MSEPPPWRQPPAQRPPPAPWPPPPGQQPLPPPQWPPPPGLQPPPPPAGPAPDVPSVWTGRAVLAFVVDVVLSLGTLAGLVVAARRGLLVDQLKYPLVVGLLGALVVSFVNRVLLQWAVRATVGKAVAGLCVMRRDNGARPGLLYLLRAWLFSFGYAFAEEAHTDTERTWTSLPVAIRRADLHRGAGTGRDQAPTR